MQEFEGWHAGPTIMNPGQRASLTWRNHNPGALRTSPFALGQRDGFAFFNDDDTGFFAMVWDLWMKSNGRTRTGLTGESTLRDLIRVYVAEPEPVVTNYVNFIQSRTGISPNTLLKNLIN